MTLKRLHNYFTPSINPQGLQEGHNPWDHRAAFHSLSSINSWKKKDRVFYISLDGQESFF